MASPPPSDPNPPGTAMTAAAYGASRGHPVDRCVRAHHRHGRPHPAPARHLTHHAPPSRRRRRRRGSPHPCRCSRGPGRTRRPPADRPGPGCGLGLPRRHHRSPLPVHLARRPHRTPRQRTLIPFPRHLLPLAGKASPPLSPGRRARRPGHGWYDDLRYRRWQYDGREHDAPHAQRSWETGTHRRYGRILGVARLPWGSRQGRPNRVRRYPGEPG